MKALVDDLTQYVDHPLTDGQPMESVTQYTGDEVVSSVPKEQKSVIEASKLIK